MNKVFLIGNLTRDPELSETSNGTAVCHFSIAVNRSYTNGDGERETDFFNVTCWRALAESTAKYCVKGNKVAVSGSVQIRTYEDNQGNKRTAVDVVAQDVEFLTQKQKAQDDTWGDHVQGNSDRRAARQPVQQSMQSFDDDGDILF